MFSFIFQVFSTLLANIVVAKDAIKDQKPSTSVRFRPVLKEAENVISCNETLSLENTSLDNPVVVQSPNFPENYPTEIW